MPLHVSQKPHKAGDDDEEEEHTLDIASLVITAAPALVAPSPGFLEVHGQAEALST